MSASSWHDDDKANRGSVFLVDDDDDLRALIGRWLESAGFSVVECGSGQECLDQLTGRLASTVCLDVTMPGLDGLETLERIRQRHPDLPVIMLTADESLESVVGAMRLGAYDYLVKPIARTKLVTTVGNAVDKHQLALRIVELQREAGGTGYGGMIGSCPAMKDLFRQLDRVAASDITTFIHGESGTGKELIARAIHEGSGRRRGPFIAVNSAAIPESLVESELFGHEKGAFTGAQQLRRGRFELAHGGTLFLDEIAELPLPAQAKLLRVLQERVVERVGGGAPIPVDFRLIAASHLDLEEQVREGHFREDLFFRVAVMDLEAPPLRERGNDVLLLARSFLRQYSQDAGHESPELSPEAAQALRAHTWPGNVRELQNVIQRAVVVCDGSIVQAQDLPRGLRTLALAPPSQTDSAGESSEAGWLSGPASMKEIERMALAASLRRNHGNVSQMMRELKISRTRIYRMLEKLGLMEEMERSREASAESEESA